MAESTAPDPVELWREMLTQWERSVNDVSNKVMTSGEFSSTANQLTAVALKIQESLGDLLDKYFRALNLPTRKDVERLDERMIAIEDLLHSMTGVLERLAPPRHVPAAAVDDVEAASHVLEFEPVATAPNGGEHAAHVVEDALVVEAPVARKTKRTASVPVAPVKNGKRPPRTKRPPSKKNGAP